MLVYGDEFICVDHAHDGAHHGATESGMRQPIVTVKDTMVVVTKDPYNNF